MVSACNGANGRTCNVLGGQGLPNVCRPPTPAELLRAIALARGWVVGNGLPDEARAGRLLLKEYTAGKLVYCNHPPGTCRDEPADTPAEEDGRHDSHPGSSCDPSEGARLCSVSDCSLNDSCSCFHQVRLMCPHLNIAC